MKGRRLARILGEDGRALVLAMDHGVIAGPLPGLESPRQALERASQGGVDAVLLNTGALSAGWRGLDRRVGVILRLTGGFTLLSDPAGFEEHMVAGAEDALFLGAEAAAVTVKFGHVREGDFMEQAARAASACARWNLPLLVEVMVRGERAERMGQAEALILACRAAAELGADLIKVAYPGSVKAMERLVAGCPAPVLVLGGEKEPDPGQVVLMVAEALKGGAAGVCMGRNLFGHARPVEMMALMAELIHGGGQPQDLARAARELQA
jgi:DhnA family fructose-bisphosphate aldolase class Ia